MITIGIDTGGTCTDAVIYDTDNSRILASGKTLTTKSNLEIGIAAAIDTLPSDMLMQADMLALSTTLATNACVENLGCRAKLLIIGTTDETIARLKDTLKGYGIDDISQFVVLDARPENIFSEPYDPDWDELERKTPELFSNCDSVGIVQVFPHANGGRFELTALRILKKHLTVPITISYDICNEQDFMRVCSSTLLNARLIPLLTDFIKAVRHVMEKRSLSIPLYIVRSDGTLMSEEMAVSCPVETLLCGPASSIIGAMELASEGNAVAVDMGGTTTDLAMIKNGSPLTAAKGVHIGQYKTSMKGLDARAFFLGGDSVLRFKDDKLILGRTRVIPLSILAEKYPTVLLDLRQFVHKSIRHTRNIHEFLVLQKDMANTAMFTEYEQQACRVLSAKPMLLQEFAQNMGRDVYKLGTERLEQEGLVIRSGITPTDMMVLKGDLTIYDPAAAREILNYISFMTGMPAADIPDFAYSLITEKLYKTIALYLLQHQYPGVRLYDNAADSAFLLDAYYKSALNSLKDHKYTNAETARISLTTDMVLIGVGAPTHVFLPKVAQLFGTRSVQPEYAHVANAVGAASCRLSSSIDIKISPVYDAFSCTGYKYMDGQKLVFITDYDEAVASAGKTAQAEVRKRAAFQGLGSDPEITLEIKEHRFGDPESGLLMDINIHAYAHSKN